MASLRNLAITILRLSGHTNIAAALRHTPTTPPDHSTPYWPANSRLCRGPAARHRSAQETEIVPYWVFDGPAKIERHLLVPPYTRDASILPHLLDSTAMYRIAFGQPRQEELLRALAAKLTDTQRTELLRIRVDLTPPAANDPHTRAPE
jgi:hypothetical protein